MERLERLDDAADARRPDVVDSRRREAAELVLEVDVEAVEADTADQLEVARDLELVLNEAAIGLEIGEAAPVRPIEKGRVEDRRI